MAGMTKVTFVFQQLGYGWTESHVLNTASSDFTTEFNAADALAKKRMLCSGAQTSMSFFRLAEIGNPRHVYLQALTGAAYGGKSSEQSDAPDTAVMLKQADANSKFASRMYLRGVWDSLVITGGQIDPASPWLTTALAGYRAQLLAGGFGFLSRGPSVPSIVAISNVQQDLSGVVNITLKAPGLPGGLVGQTILANISRVVGAASINGPQLVNVVTATTLQTVKRLPILSYLSGGQVRFTTTSFVAIGFVQIQRVVERKVGRPLYHSRGRSRVRKLA